MAGMSSSDAGPSCRPAVSSLMQLQQEGREGREQALHEGRERYMALRHACQSLRWPA